MKNCGGEPEPRQDYNVILSPEIEIKVQGYRSFVRMTISSEVAVHQTSYEHRVVNIC